MREHVEERTLSFAAAVEEFVRCAQACANASVRLLALHPGIAHANLQAEIVLGDAAAVSARLQKEPEAARRPGGIQNWEPLLYACHTCLHHDAPERAAGLVEIARVLLAHGANPNAEYHWNWHRELPRTALWAALCATSHLPLAQVLLEGGANPTDGVSTHITAGSGNLAALELLQRFGLNVDGIPGGVPPLRYILSWADKDAACAGCWSTARIRISRGANRTTRRCTCGPTLGCLDGRTARQARRRYSAATRRRPHCAYAGGAARQSRDRRVAAGARREGMSCRRWSASSRPAHAAIARAASDAAGGTQAAQRAAREHHLMMHVPAERGDAKVLDAMLACGFDPNVKDSDGVTLCIAPRWRATRTPRAS